MPRGIVALLAEGVDRNTLLPSSALMARTSPSSRRAWIEIAKQGQAPAGPLVALLAEGVDRNNNIVTELLTKGVALLAEGVDRNLAAIAQRLNQAIVALLAEGVDRNTPER